MRSQYDHYYEDRLFDYRCKNLHTGVSFDHCYLTGNDGEINAAEFLHCGENYVMVGVLSHVKYDVGHNDRLNQLYCCRTPGWHTESCSLSEFLNEWEGERQYETSGDRVFTGLFSYHRDQYE